MDLRKPHHRSSQSISVSVFTPTAECGRWIRDQALLRIAQTIPDGPPITAAGNANSVEVQLAEKIVGSGTDYTLGNFDTARVDRVITAVTDTLRGRGQQVPDGVTAADLVTNEFIDPAIGLRAQ